MRYTSNRKEFEPQSQIEDKHCPVVYSIVLTNSFCSSINLVSQSESRIQILLQFVWFSLMQPDVARTPVLCSQVMQTSTLGEAQTQNIIGCPSYHWKFCTLNADINNGIVTFYLGLDSSGVFTHLFHTSCLPTTSHIPHTLTHAPFQSHAYATSLHTPSIITHM